MAKFVFRVTIEEFYINIYFIKLNTDFLLMACGLQKPHRWVEFY